MKFWPQDWVNDGALRLCSAAARGLWVDMICAMHTAEPYGHLTINNRPMRTREIAMFARMAEKEVTRLLAEMEDLGVFSRTDDGTIYSRRMVRDHEASEEGKRHVTKRGGTWSNGEPPSSPPNTPPNRGPTRKADSPPNTLEAEAEARKKEPEAAPQGAASAVAPAAPEADALPEEQRKWLFSAGLEKLQRMSGLSGQRCRGVLGKALKAAEDRPFLVVQAICDLPLTGDPVAWLLAAVRPKRYPSGWHQVMAEDAELAASGEELDPYAEFRRAALGTLEPHRSPEPRLRLAHG